MLSFARSSLVAISIWCCACAPDGTLDGQRSSSSLSDPTLDSAPVADAHRSCYVARSLGTLGGAFSNPRRINGRGQVAGLSSIRLDDPLTHAFLWHRGHMTDLGALGDYSLANDLNDRGDVAGRSRDSNGVTHAVLWDPALVDLGTFGGTFSEAVALNERGQVVGFSLLAGDTAPHAFLWQHGALQDLGTLGGASSYATGVNNWGEVIGNSETAAGELHCFVWRHGHMRDLGTFGGGFCSAGAINDRGEIAGTARTAANEDHAFRWEYDRLIDLGTLGGSVANGQHINGRGEIIGRSLPAVGGDPDGFVVRHRHMMDLDVTHRFVPSAINDATVIAGSFFESPGGSRAAVWRNGSFLELTSKDSGASDLNDAGQIAGYIADGTGEQIATMWTPTRCKH